MAQWTRLSMSQYKDKSIWIEGNVSASFDIRNDINYYDCDHVLFL